MTQEEKDLLLKDLCARLPYGVKCHIKIKDGTTEMDDVVIPSTIEHLDIWDIKPYLRPMSSMTEEELKENWTFMEKDGRGFPTDLVSVSQFSDGKFAEYLDWLNAHHFDYRGLIPKGLALEALEGMYKED